MNDDFRSFQKAIEECKRKALGIILGAPQRLEPTRFSFHDVERGSSCILTTRGQIAGEHPIHYSVALTMVRRAHAWVAEGATVFCGIIGEHVESENVPSGMTEFSCTNGDPALLKRVA